jgi:glycosyltransferase involved in cell wall biosynthesis
VNVLVSIIVPVYNCANYLNQCIDSILSQSYTNMEVLLIDDGSIDRSGQICDEYAKKNKRIRVFHKENTGVSDTRNYGILKASGDLLQFVDSDDWITKTMTKDLVESMKCNDSDMVVCGYIRITKYMKRKDKIWDKQGVYTNKDYVKNVLNDPTGYYYGVIWNKLYKSSIIRNHHLQFISNLNLGEDFAFNLQYLRYVKTISTIEKRLYVYNYINDGSLSRYNKITLEIQRNELNNREILFEEYKKTFSQLGLYERYEKKIYQYWLCYYYSNIHPIIERNSKEDTAGMKHFKGILETNEEIKRCLRLTSKIEKGIVLSKIQCNKALRRIKGPIKHLIMNLKQS